MSSLCVPSTRASPVAKSRATACMRSWLAATALVWLTSGPLAAQQAPAGLQPGEAFVTRFSGATAQPATGAASMPSIDVNGIVGSIIDIRSPAQPPNGEHWMDEPQRSPVTAGEIGQVFGVVLDDQAPPNIYLSATAAFGLHLMPGSQQWMNGMWGRGGGPGTIYRLDAATGYRPRIFTHVTLAGRPNSGAALGNMAFDRLNKQIFVSDLETGMIHRIRAGDGADLGAYDHGTQGRSQFLDVGSKQQQSLPPIAFDPGSRALIGDCPSGAFESSPECWNLAASGRRVWGVGVRRDPQRGDARLYYGVWSSPAFGQTAWNAATEEDKRNAVWSVRLGPGGAFDPSDVRREFLLPDFFVKPEDVARAGYSQPVSDITFSECGQRPIMLVSERGGMRNLGLAAENAFAWPHEARTLRYELDQTGGWQPVGRYDIGFYDRQNDGEPFMNANCAGGAAFGFGYKEDWSFIDPSKPDQFIWLSGDSLLAGRSLPRAGGRADRHGAAGRPAGLGAAGEQRGRSVGGARHPGHARKRHRSAGADGSFTAFPQSGAAYNSIGPVQSYLIDTDINADASGTPIQAEFIRNDATKIGDIAIYQTCAPPPPPSPAMLLPPPPVGVMPVIEGHAPALTHATIASHGERSSHFRVASHNPWWSHERIRSHNRWQSHNVILSGGLHRPIGSIHRPRGSFHRPPGSFHRPIGSLHRPFGSVHRPRGSLHLPPGSIHRPPGSIHGPRLSPHLPIGSLHRPLGSIHRPPASPHFPVGSQHRPLGSVHRPIGSLHRLPHSPHWPIGSSHRPPGSVHQPPGTLYRPLPTLHRPAGSLHRTGPIVRRQTITHRPAGSLHRTGPIVRRQTITHRPATIHRGPVIRRTTPNLRRTTLTHRPATITRRAPVRRGPAIPGSQRRH